MCFIFNIVTSIIKKNVLNKFHKYKNTSHSIHFIYSKKGQDLQL